MTNETPILKTLEDYLSRNPIRMHVPFHTGIANNAIFPKDLYKLDISEVSGYDVEGEDNPIFQSEKITANNYSVKHSFYLTGGASVGLLASLIALNKFGKKIILARNVHKSVINGVVLSGLEPIWLEVDFLDKWGIFSKVDLNKLHEVISRNEDIAGCVVVSPTYEGVISDIKEIANICHKKDIPLIVDEAHGAHLYFLNKYTMQDVHFSAIDLGADLVIQSWHKSLGSLTQSGVLHLVDEKFFSYHDIKRSLDLVSSTSPSFLLLLSLELTRRHSFQTKGEYFRGLYNVTNVFRDEIKSLKNISCFTSDDPLKVYLTLLSSTGIDFAYDLYKRYAIEIESANEVGFLMLIGINFNEVVKDKVFVALREMSCRYPIGHSSFKQFVERPQTNEFKLNPRDAFMLGYKNGDKKNINEKRERYTTSKRRHYL